jgi:hypothetical protein
MLYTNYKRKKEKKKKEKEKKNRAGYSSTKYSLYLLY